MSVGDTSDDNLGAVPTARPVPVDVSIDAFVAQCTEALLKRLRRYALFHARLPGGEQLGDRGAYAEELVQSVATDVLAGVLRWDPAARDLESLMVDVIRLRVRRDRTRAGRHVHVPLNEGDSTAERLKSRWIGREVARRANHPTSSPDSALTMLPRLREQVAGDPRALRFLAAIEHGSSTRAEIMHAAQLSRDEYHNTRRRLARLLARLQAGDQPSREGN